MIGRVGVDGENMNNKNGARLFVSLVFIFILLSNSAKASGIFTIVTLDESLAQANVKVGVSYPPKIDLQCELSDGTNSTCRPHFSLLLPEWVVIDTERNKATVFESRRFILYHPATIVAKNSNCKNRVAGAVHKPEIAFNNSKILISYPELEETNFAFLENDNFDCYYYEFPVLNPNFVEKKTKMYPFDEYIARFGFMSPYDTDFRMIFNVPEQYFVSNVNSTAVVKNITKEKNLVYVVINPLIGNQSSEFYIKFNRIPDNGVLIFESFIIGLLPMILAIFFVFSESGSHVPESRITGMYIGVLPIFLSLLWFIPSKPASFTIFDVSIACSFTLLSLSLVKDIIGIRVRKLFRGIITILIILFFLLVWNMGM